MLKEVKDLGSTVLFQVDLSANSDNADPDFSLISKCLDNNREPFFRISVRDLIDCKIVTKGVSGHEEDVELQKRNLFLQCEINEVDGVNKRLVDFLIKYSQRFGTWSGSDKDDQSNKWFSFINGRYIFFKITDQSEYYIRIDKKMTHCEVDWETQILHFTGKKDISLVICRGYDIISNQSFWCLNQLVV